MLYQTFCHIDGIGKTTEKKLWQAGITHWSHWDDSAPVRLSGATRALATEVLELSLEAVEQQRPEFFTRILPNNQHWRLFPHFRQKTAFIDIETTGLSHDSQITTITLYDGRKIYTYVNGLNLEEFVEDIYQYQVLVSFNGKCFDVPFLERQFKIRLDHAQIDLRYVLPSIGIKGGLKKCETQLGINRGGLDGVEGYEAVLLWHDYQNNGNERALETLLAYNIEDTVNLEQLLIIAYNRCLAGTPFKRELELEMANPPMIGYQPDLETLDNIRKSNAAYTHKRPW